MKRFSFELTPLLRKRAWDIDALRLEKSIASRVVTEYERTLNEIEITIQTCSNSLIKASDQDAEISIVQRQIMGAYLQHQHDLAAETKASLKNAQDIERQVTDQLLTTSQQLKALEKMRDSAQKKHEYFRLRAEFNETDDSWLAAHKPL